MLLRETAAPRICYGLPLMLHAIGDKGAVQFVHFALATS